MDNDLAEKMKYLRLIELARVWDETMSQAKEKNPSYTAFTKQIIDNEVSAKKERCRQIRIKKSKVESMYLFETYPFSLQPNLSKKKFSEILDSMTYMTKKQNVIFIGPTGVGKTGLATAMLIHAINKEFSGRFITFPDLLNELYKSSADHSEKKVLHKFLSYDCLIVDELGYVEIDPHQAGLFFTLMKQRHKKSTTIVTTQLGFKEWTGFLKNSHLTAALIDRLTENSQLINLGKCQSIRK